MLTTLLLSIACAECPELPEAPLSPQRAAVTRAVLNQAGSDLQKAAELKIVEAIAPLRAQPGSSSGRSSYPSILKVSEETAKDVPSGSAAVYLESGRPVLDDREAQTLKCMLMALRLSVEPQEVEPLATSPRAFKVSTVRNDNAVDPKDEAQQSIYASIQSSMIGI